MALWRRITDGQIYMIITNWAKQTRLLQIRSRYQAINYTQLHWEEEK